MKKFLLLVVLVLGLLCLASNLEAAGREGMGYQVITSSGVTVIYFPTTADKSRIATEIYVVTMTTNPAYVNWFGATPTTSHFLLGISGDTDVIEHTQQVESGCMSILQDELPVHIRVQWKYRIPR